MQFEGSGGGQLGGSKVGDFAVLGQSVGHVCIAGETRSRLEDLCTTRRAGDEGSR